jgi:hypothetical protein
MDKELVMIKLKREAYEKAIRYLIEKGLPRYIEEKEAERRQ